MKKMVFIFIIIFSCQLSMGWSQDSYVLTAVRLIHGNDTFKHQLNHYIEHYDDLASSHPERKKQYLIQNTQAQYLAFLSENQPQHLNKLLKMYQSSRWKTKQALLAIFSKMSHPQVKELLLTSALHEPDEEFKLKIERIAHQSQSVQDLYSSPINNKHQLAHYWSGYMANGNTQVVKASIALLSNSITGYSLIKDGTGKPIKRIFPHRKRLKEEAVTVLNYFIKHDETIRQLCVNSRSLFLLKEMQPILTELASMVIHSKDKILFDKIINYLEQYGSTTQAYLDYYKALSAGTNGNYRKLRNQLARFERQSTLLAIPLNGHYQKMIYEQDKLNWKANRIFNEEKKQALALLRSCQLDQSWQSYEYWTADFSEKATPVLQQPFYQVILGYDRNNQKKLVFNMRVIPECWLLEKERVYRWNNNIQKWHEINSELIQTNLQHYFDLIKLKTIIEKQEPRSIQKIIRAGKNNLILVQYKNLSSKGIIQPGLNEIKSRSMSISAMDYYMDEKTGEPVSYELIISDNSSSARAIKVTRLFYEYGQATINWIKRE